MVHIFPFLRPSLPNTLRRSALEESRRVWFNRFKLKILAYRYGKHKATMSNDHSKKAYCIYCNIICPNYRQKKKSGIQKQMGKMVFDIKCHFYLNHECVILFACLYIIHCRTKMLMVIHQFCLASCNSNTDLCQELDWLKRGIQGAKFHQFPAWQRRRLGLDSLVGLESLSLIDLEKITVVSMLQMKSESVWKVC